MPKEKNKTLNPYYLELLKYLVVYKFKNRLGLDLSTEERNDLASELKEYNTKDSLNRIFSLGEKRRQNFNKSNLQGLCNYIGYIDWDEFVSKEYQSWADDLEDKIYADLSEDIFKKLNKSIFIRILQEIEGKIIDGIADYFNTYLIKQNNNINTQERENVVLAIMRLFHICVDYIATTADEAHLMVIYKVAENIDEGRATFEGFNLPKIFRGELYRKTGMIEKTTIVDQLIDEVENPLNKEVMRLYKEGYPDDEIMLYFNFQGIEIDVGAIKLIRWQTADRIFNQLKMKEDGRKLLQD